MSCFFFSNNNAGGRISSTRTTKLRCNSELRKEGYRLNIRESLFMKKTRVLPALWYINHFFRMIILQDTSWHHTYIDSLGDQSIYGMQTFRTGIEQA